jgi:hypothetical protein
MKKKNLQSDSFDAKFKVNVTFDVTPNIKIDKGGGR